MALITTIKQDWSKRMVFEEARKIVTAEYQNIVVNELMPVLVGSLKASLLSSEYDEQVDVSVSAEEVVLGLGLAEMFEYGTEVDITDPDVNLDKLLSMRSSSRPQVGFSSHKIKNLEEIASFSKKLGIENWLKIQQRCPMLSFSDGVNGSNPLHNIVVEKPINGELLGSTLCCFFFQLVDRVISGDKYWYQNQLSAEQSLTLRSSSISSLICHSSEKENHLVQKNALLLPDSSMNAAVPCKTFVDLDIATLLSDDDLEIFDFEMVLIDEVVASSRKELDWRMKQEENLYLKKQFASSTSSRGSPSFGKPTRASLELASISSVLEIATYKLNNMTEGGRAKRSPHSFHHGRNIISSNTINRAFRKKIDSYHSKSLKLDSSECSAKEDDFPCDHTSRYRSFSGRCNNLQSPNDGKSVTAMKRLLQSEYQDGISSPRSRSVSGQPLPNPRSVSQLIHTPEATPDTAFTLTMMQWGQFIDHDLALTPIPRGFKDSILDCMSCNSGSDHPSCYPILIPGGDSHFPRHTCMAFTRSLPAQDKLGPREQFNQVTHFLDASMVYGSTDCHAEELRVHGGYLMRMSPNPLAHPKRPMKDLLPMTGNNHECRSSDGQCFLAGDERVNEQPGLTSFHTTMVREHNYISKKLAGINKHWTNEKVFQETRRIVSAIVQHITFNEFLPRVLGPVTLKKFSLELLPNAYYDDYNPECSASIFTEFASAAFRFGHSMIKPNLTMMKEEDMMEGGGDDIQLRSHFNNPDLMRFEGAQDSIVRGLVMVSMEVMDNRITEEVKDHLFEEKNKKFSGLDLPAINIQRSRDHGIPGYNKYREICGLGRKTKFDFDEIPHVLNDLLYKAYKHPDDVDLFPGMLAEIKLSGAAVGPTLACLIGLQFRHLRSCDRFWYESGDPTVRFTKAQLQTIRGQTLSGLLCRNCDKPGMLPQSGMDKMQRLTNPMTHCGDMKHIDLEVWREGKNGECVRDGVNWALGSSIYFDGKRCTCTKEGFSC